MDSAPVLRSLRERARAEARIPTGFLGGDHRRAARRGADRDGRARRGGRGGFTDDGLPVRSAGVLRQALQYQRLAGRLLALHEEDPSLSGDGVMHEGEVSALLGVAGIPSVSESTMVARDCALAALRGGPHPRPARLGARVRRGDRARQGRRGAGHLRGHAAPPAADRRGRARARHQHEDEPAAARRGRPRGADRRRCARARSTASPPTTRRTRARRRSSRSSSRRWASPASRRRSPRSTPDLVLPGLSLDLLVERMTAGGEPFGPHVPVARAGLARERLPGRPRRRVGGGGGGLREPLGELRLRRPPAHRRVRMTIADGAVAYRERSFAIGAVA